MSSVYSSYAVNDGAEEANDCNDDELKLDHQLNCVLTRFDNDLASTRTTT